MADNVQISAGTADGKVIRTDETAGGQHVQFVKLALSADASDTPIAADANGLDVDVTRLPGLASNSGVDIGDVTVNNSASSPVPVTQVAATRPTAIAMHTAATATGNGTPMNVEGYATALVSLTGTWAATITFEASVDDVTWTAILGTRVGDVVSAAPSSTTASLTGEYEFSVAGYKSLRARVSSYASGNVTAKGYALATPAAQKVVVVVTGAQPLAVGDGGSTVSVDDGGGALTVDNAGTFPVQVNGAALTALQLIDDLVEVDDAGFTVATTKGAPVMGAYESSPSTVGDGDLGVVGITVDRRLKTNTTVSGTVPLPSGAATAAKQPALGTAGSASSDVLTVQGVASMTPVQVSDGGGSLTVDGTVTANISSSNNLVKIGDGTDTADVLDLANANPLVVALVDGNGDQIVSFGGGTQYTEDAAAAANPVGTVPILVRVDTPAGAVSADGDNVAQRGSNYGAAYVTLLDTSGNPVAVGGGTQYTEDAAAAANPVGTVPILVRKDTPASEVSADGDNVAQRGSAYGASYVTLLDTSGNPVAVGGGTQYTEDAAAAANPVGTALIMVRADALAGVTSADGDNVAARATDKGELYVKHVDAVPVTDNGGSLTVDGSVAVSALPASTNTIEVVGDAAHDAAAAGNPVLLGAYAKAAAPTDVSADGDVVRLWADLAGRLQVGDGGGSLTVDGSVTANAGTNLNTSALALESGGNLAAAAASLSVLDDWDESDRAKVNPIAGQAGVQGGSGAVSSTTQRVVLATDVALPAGTNAIGKLAANSGVDIGDVDVTSLPAIPTGTNSIGRVNVEPQTTNGLSVFNATSSDGATALTSTAQAIKASAGQVYGWYIYNPNATAQFVQFYNTAQASVTVGTTNPLFMLTIPPTSAANVEFTNGITFSNAGFSCAATSTAGGNGAPGTALDVVVFYK